MVERAASSQARRSPSSRDARPITFDGPTLHKVRWCRRRLLAWYDRHGRNFPWRSPKAGLYRQVVVEVLLQRTQAPTIGRFFDPFFKSFGSWEEIHAAPLGTLENALRPVGLWRRRAAALKGLAREMVRRGGGFPASRDELEALPAVGQYVASAVLLFAHNRPEPLLDGNMARVLERVFKPRRLVDIRYDRGLQTLARVLVQSKEPVRVNWAILDVAALHCGARAPACDGCPLRRGCNYAAAIIRVHKTSHERTIVAKG
jgi:A/G-specific adenine glycosylase